MKNILSALAVFVYFGAFGQQVNISSATAFESVVVESMLPVGDDIIVFGNSGFFQAFCARISPYTGDVIWSHKSEFDWDGNFTSSARLPNGNIVAVGYQGGAGLVSVFAPDGTLVWSKVVYPPASDAGVNLYGVTVSPTGDIFTIGRFLISGVSGDVLIRLDGSTGNIEYSTRVVTQGARGAIHFRGDSLFVVGASQLGGNHDISLSVYNPVDGALLVYKTFGTFSNEVLWNAAFSNEGIFFTYIATGVYVGKIRWSTLTMAAQDPVLIFAEGGDVSLNSAQISVSADGVYVSGGAVGTGFRRSYAIKLTHNLAALWARYLTPSVTATSSVYGTSSLVLPSGDVLFADLVEDVDFSMSTVITGLTPSGANGTYCQNPMGFDFQTGPNPLAMSVRNPVQMGVSLGEIPYPFMPYGIDVENCNLSILPVELLFFRAEKSGDVVRLSWATETERGSSHFDVLRSSDGIRFEKIGEVRAAGDSQITTDYSFVDDAPLDGTSYYKLESVDLDGSTEFSETEVVHFDVGLQSISVYPNPSVSGDPVTVRGEFQSVVAFDQLGRSIPLEMNGNQLVVQAGPGVYLLIFVSADGAYETVKVVIE